MKWIQAGQRKPEKACNVFIRNFKDDTCSFGAYDPAIEETESLFDEGDHWLDESPTTADASVLKAALERIESAEVPEEEEFTFDPRDFILQLKGIARKALAQYNTQSQEPKEGKEDDPLLWIKVLKEVTGTQSYDGIVLKSLKSKYHITKKQTTNG